MSTATRTNEERAAEFVTAVRDRLSDLPRDDVDELTDGLTADLVDRLGDGSDLGDPTGYAEELRQAAGLPERVDPVTDVPAQVGPLERGRALVDGWREWWDETNGRRGVRDFVLSLRPAWWILRGVVVATLAGAVFGVSVGSLAWLLLATAATILSVQWGRGKWLPGAWAVWLRRIGSVLAILALLPLANIALDRLSYASASAESETWTPPGLASSGEEITNIFAYDCAGEPLGAVQLFAQDGSPLHTGEGKPGSYADWLPMSGVDANGEWIDYRRNAAATMPDDWNVFPLRELSSADIATEDEVAELSEQPGEAPALPYERVPVLGDCAALNADEAAAADDDKATDDSKTTEDKGSGDPKSAEDAKDSKDAKATP